MKVKRICMSLFGVLLCAVSVGIFKIAALGVDPFQTLMSGVDSLGLIDFGTMYLVANALLLVFALVFDRKKIGIATFINMFLLGYVTEYTYRLLGQLLPHPQMITRLACLTLGILLLCISSALYMTADLGVSTYDAVAIVLSDRTPVPFKFARILTDFVCVTAGCAVFLLGGGTWRSLPIGVATILTAFFMGPLIDFFNRTLARPMLFGKKQ